ncbi:MAG: guanine deaminase [Pseudomonadota bacterium]
MTETLILGRTLTLDSDPFDGELDASATYIADGAVLVRDGVIAAVGDAATLQAEHPDAEGVDHKDCILSAGFVDCHNHYPQTGIIASWGKRLIDWLNGYTFPEEMRFGDRAYADDIAGRYLDLLIGNGITSSAAYCTIHPESVEALFTAAEARNMRLTAGKVLMDRNAPDGLRDNAQIGYDQSKALIKRWSGVGRLTYAVTPRFAPTSSPEQLDAAGALWAEHPDCAMQTHLSEQPEEIAWVRELYPDAADYLDVYQSRGLTGPGAIMGHSIHLEPREIAALAETRSAIAHCPTSNTFIGSGLCDVTGLKAAGVEVGLATDVGGGSSFSMLATMKAAYEVGQLSGASLHASQLLWLATMGSARAMRIGDKVGRLASGMEADIVALDPAATPVLAQRTERAEDIWDVLFALIILGDDRAIRETWVAGRPKKGA